MRLIAVDNLENNKNNVQQRKTSGSGRFNHRRVRV